MPVFPRRLRVVVAVLTLAAWFSPPATALEETPAGENPLVHQDGQTIVDGSGRPLKLRGVNLGGWLLWEAWIWGGATFISETTVAGRLADILGPVETDRFRADVHARFVTEADIARVARMGFNAVRVPINHTLLEDDARPYDYKPAGWAVMDAVLAWAEKYNVYVILDLHAAPGGQSPLFIADPEDGNSLWVSQENKARTAALWKAVAARYKDRSIVAGYDLLNEPDTADGEALADLYRQIVASVREVDPAHMVIIEGNKHATDFSAFTGPFSSNQAYSFHLYTWFGDNRQELLDGYRRISDAQQVPMWCGEFGENNYEMVESTVRLFERPENNVNGWSFWTWKKAPERYPALVAIDLPSNWRSVFGALTSSLWPLFKPTAPATRQALADFLGAVALESTTTDRAMERALTGFQGHTPTAPRGLRRRQ